MKAQSPNEAVTLLITTDHGRQPVTFWTHGSLTWAERALVRLAIGPDIQADQVITSHFRQHEDVVPTIGYLFERHGVAVQTPEAEGVVMRELFLG